MAEQKISQSLDIYFDRTKKSIGQWIDAYSSADLRIVNGHKYIPEKKRLQDIYQYVLLDNHLSSVIEQRKSKVTGEPYAVFKNDNIDDELTKLLSKQWFSSLQNYVIDARFYGYSLIEIQELISNEISGVKSISRGNVIPEFRSIIKNPYQTYSESNLISIDNRNDSDYYILVDGEKSHGLLNSVVPLCIMKRITLAYWSEHSMQYGIPPVILKTDNRENTPQFHKDLTDFVHSRKIVIGLSDELSVLQTSGTDPHNIYKELIETCNAEISKSIIGQTSTTDVKSYVGSAEVHERVANEIAESDRAFMTYIINDVVFPKLIALGYRLHDAVFRYVSQEKRSYSEKLETIKVLKETGYIADPSDVKTYLDLPFELEIGGDGLTASIEKKSPDQAVALAILDDLRENYKRVCAHSDEYPVNALDEIDPELDTLLDQIIQNVYLQNYDPLNPEYIKLIADQITTAVFETLEVDTENFSNDQSQEYEALKQKIYYFVGGKNKILTQSFQELLFDADNRFKTFSQFKADAKAIGLEFNKHHLRTEYQTAIANAQSIVDWKSFEDDDLLMYSTVGDARVRESHARLDGLTLPKKDSLWSSIAPVNAWGCRCRLLSVPSGRKSTLTRKERVDFKKLPDDGFKFNPGVAGELFPTNHPYLKALAEEDKKRIDELLQ